jgi:uncharacterized protein (TIGR02271 family)
MPTNTTVDRLLEMKGKPVHANQEQVGVIDQIFLDEETNRPEWIGLDGGGLFGGKQVLVPLERAQIEQDCIRVPYDKQTITRAPDFSGSRVSQETERRLYENYGLTYSHQASSTGLPQGGQRQRPTNGGETMTRSEEELKVGKREVSGGQMRLRKFVETEPVQADVTLRRETAEIERTPVNKPVAGTEIREQEISVELKREEPVVEKQAVVKEQVRLKKDAETENRQIQGEVRKERIETDKARDQRR